MVILRKQHVQRQHPLIATLSAGASQPSAVGAAQTLLDANCSALSEHLDVCSFKVATKIFGLVAPEVL